MTLKLTSTLKCKCKEKERENSMKYTLITGASSGIGKAVAELYASKKKNLILVARRVDRLEVLKKNLEEQFGVDIVIMPCDLSDIASVYEFYGKTKQYTIETWINNAGFGHGKSVIDQDLERVSQMIHLNVESLTILSTLYARDYENIEGSTLVNVSSTVGYGVSSRVPAYSATKFYVSAFTEALYYEMKDKKAALKVRVLAPASTATEFGMVSSGKEMPVDMKFEGNTAEEMAEFLEKLVNSDQCLGYIETDDYTFHLSNPRIPHSFTKKSNPNLLKR